MSDRIKAEDAARVLHETPVLQFTSAHGGICSRCNAQGKVWLGKREGINKQPWYCFRCVGELVAELPASPASEVTW